MQSAVTKNLFIKLNLIVSMNILVNDFLSEFVFGCGYLN